VSNEALHNEIKNWVPYSEVLQIPPTEVGGSFRSFLQTDFKNNVLIPPTAVGGYFKSTLLIRKFRQQKLVACSINRSYLNNPPTSVGGIETAFFDRCRKDLNDPPTAVGGI
jgi:hypothetical protein